MILQLDSENADYDLTSLQTVLTHTPDAERPRRCQVHVALGDGAKNLDGTGGLFELTVSIGSQVVQPSSQEIEFEAGPPRAAIDSQPFMVPANAAVLVKVLSPNAADSDVDVTATLYDLDYDPQELPSDSATFVAPATTDALRGAAFAAGLTAAKALQPGTNALAIDNWGYLLVPPGQYDLTEEVAQDLDQSYLKIMSTDLVPITRADWWEHVEKVNGLESDLLRSRLRNVILYRTDDEPVLTQSVDHIEMYGLDVILRSNLEANDAADAICALWISAASNAGSKYSHCFFWKDNPSGSQTTINGAVGSLNDCKGTWEWCLANAKSWRVKENKTLGGQHYYTCGGWSCWAGDSIGASVSGLFWKCAARGATNADTPEESGAQSWGGCGSWGADITSECESYDCWCGPKCWGIGRQDAGRHYGGTCGAHCHGATSTQNPAWAGEFAGYAENIVSVSQASDGNASLGGEGTNVSGLGKFTGTIKNCTILGLTKPIRSEGGTIDGCMIQVSANNIDAITLITNSNTTVTNSTILVVQGGTGVAINAGSALSVAAAGNRINNIGQAADGLGANVTNVGTAPGDDTPIPELTAAADAPATPTLRQAQMLQYMALRNNSQTTASERRIFNDAGAEVLDAAVADDGTTFSQGKLGDA